LFDTNPDVPAASLPHLAQDRLLSAMRVVESLPPSARGALLVGPHDEPFGTILIESNRVCWGAAPGMSGRFRDILRSHCKASICDGEFEAIYTRCRRESQPLGDALVVSGLVSADHMRAAIKQHTIESLLAVDAAVANLCGSRALAWPMQWIDHAGRGYNPRYTFGAVEVLAAAGAQRLDQTEAEVMTDHLEGLADAHSALVAFSFQPDGTPLFVGASTQLPLDLRDLIDLTTWAGAALGASPGFSPEVARACTRSAEYGAVAWRYQGQSCAAICMDGASLQRLTVNLGNQSLAMVLATRTAVLDRVRERTQAMTQGE
jgi:hypothetical protein